MHATTIGLDLAKNNFQVHGVADDGSVVFNRSLRRAQLLTFFQSQQPCLVGMEACATSHYWARELTALGHEVRLMPPNYVKPYVKRGKSDAADAEAICEAVTRPSMRTVPVKSVSQQSLLCQHRARELLVGQRTQLSNSIRGLLGEFGETIRSGAGHLRDFAQSINNGSMPDLPAAARHVISALCDQLINIHNAILLLDRQIYAAGRTDHRIRLLRSIPGIGPITASAIVATIGSADTFKSGRDLAAWIGLTPINKSSGGKERLGGISKKGDRYLRKLLVVGMTSRIAAARAHPERADPWITNILQRKPARVATVAIANKTARIVWAVLSRDEPYLARASA